MAIIGHNIWQKTEKEYEDLLQADFWYCQHSAPSRDCYEELTRRKILTVFRARFNLLALSNTFLITAKTPQAVRYNIKNDTTENVMSYGETRAYPDIIDSRIFTFYSEEKRKRVFIDLTKLHSRIEFEKSYVYYNSQFILIEVYNPNNPEEITTTYLRSTFDDLAHLCTFPSRTSERGEECLLLEQKLYIGSGSNVFCYDCKGLQKLNKEPLPCKLTLEHPYALFSSKNREESVNMIKALEGNPLKNRTEPYIFILEQGKLVVFQWYSRKYFDTGIDCPVHVHLRHIKLIVFGKNEIVKFNLIDFSTLSREKLNTTITRFESANDMFALLNTKEGKQLWNLSKNKFESTF